MRYVDTTVAQLARVAGGWTVALGLVFLVLTFGELFTSSRPVGLTISATVTAAGLAAFVPGDVMTRRYQHRNRLYFMDHVGSEILGRRRRFERGVAIARNITFGAALICGVTFLALVGGIDCPTEATCSGAFAGHLGLVHSSRAIMIVLLAATLAAASLHRVHSTETDHLEDIASDALRRRDDGPIPGLKRSRWD